jgi:hypothetical protein
MPFRSAFYAPLTILHGSVIVRLVGDLSETAAAYRASGGMLNAVALAVFVATAASTVRRSV